MDAQPMKPEFEPIESSPVDAGSNQETEQTGTPVRRGRGRPRGSKGTPRKPVSDTGGSAAASPSTHRPSRGRGRGRGGNSAGGKRGRAAVSTPATKAGKSGASAMNSNADYMIHETMLDSPPEDEDVIEDAADDSEYAPSDGEPAIKPNSSRKRGAASRTRRQKKFKSMHEESDEDDDDDEEDMGEDDEETSESESELEDTIGLVNEVTELHDSTDAAGVSNLFQDDNPNEAKDIYDFDAQSILSDKRLKNLRRRSARTAATGVPKAPTVRHTRSNNAANTSWGSNVYSALATSLKTRPDLDAYTNFLKCPYLNSAMDAMFVDICKPSNQHSGLFFGPSSSLQSLMGRVNDPDRVVELLHAFMSKPYDNLANRILWFAPIIHQQPVSLAHVTSLPKEISSVATSLDPDMRIDPCYVLDGGLNVLVQTGPPFTDLVVSLSQYNAINSAGNVGRFMTDVSQIVLSSDFYDYLNDMVALPMEKIIRYAERADEGVDVNIDALEPPCLQRIVAAVDADSKLIGIAVTDTWGIESVPLSRNRRVINFENSNRGTVPLLEYDRSSKVCEDTPIEMDAFSILEQLVNTVARTRELEAASEKDFMPPPTQLGRVHLIDCFLIKPNGRKDTLLLVCYEPSSNPPLPPKPKGTNPFKIYSLVDEERFFFQRFGISSDLPALMDGMFTADPELLIERKASAVLPNILFDNLKSVCLREIVASSGSAIVNAVLTQLSTPKLATGTHHIYQCSKFILVDSQRRVPLAIVFEAPIRLSWSSSSKECSVRAADSSIQDEFAGISPEFLRDAEANFAPEARECRLVAINGIMYALQADDNRVVQRLVELVPARCENVTGHPNRVALSSQVITADSRSYPLLMRVINEENATSSVFPAVFYPHCNYQVISEYVANFCDELADHIYTSPVAFSLYDVVFRMALKHTPKILARQHRDAAEAAAAAAAAANPNDPPPAPVPLPEHWGVCSICAKELHSLCGLLEHELRHVGLTRFRCDEHGLCFVDRRALLQHIAEHPPNALSAPIVSKLTQEDGGSDDEDITNANVALDGEVDEVLKPGLAHVFSRNILEGRMEAPQCEHCRDYFPTADVMALHLDICDRISFKERCPLEHVSADGSAGVIEDGETGCVCGICGQRVNSVADMTDHFAEKHLGCEICGVRLRTIEELSYHYKIHIDELNSKFDNENDKVGKVMTCETCLTFYCTKYNYYFHQWAMHGVIYQQSESAPGVFTPIQVRQPKLKGVSTLEDTPEAIFTKIKCKFCYFLSPISGKLYVSHLETAHNISTDILRICKICGEVTDTCDEMSTHLQDHHVASGDFAAAGSQTIFSCAQCTFFAFSKGMLQHSALAHNDFAPNMYACPHCNQRFNDRRLWRGHLDKHTEGMMHNCNDCGKDFRSRQALLHHIQTRHFDWEEGPVTCEQCGITYPKMSSLRYHIARMHNQEMEHECPVCQQRFRVETYLRRHMKETHSGSIQCEICHKMCANLRCYSQHRQKHFRTKIFQCKECSATFKSKTAMRRHVRVEHMQLGPEKFECQICGKIVTQIGMHMLTHKDARFECEYCFKRFTKSVYYNEHIRIHRGELPFECHICRRRFNKKSNLNVHLKFHEKHRDDEGNYLELKARGRVSTMFGDASMTPEERAAKDAAMKLRGGKPKMSVACGSDFPGAFNCGGPPDAATEAAAISVPLLPDTDVYSVPMPQPTITPVGSTGMLNHSYSNGGGNSMNQSISESVAPYIWAAEVKQVQPIE